MTLVRYCFATLRNQLVVFFSLPLIYIYFHGLFQIVLTMAIGIDHPPKRLFKGTIFKSETPEAKSSGTQTDKEISFEDSSYCLNYKILQDVIIWSILWWGCVLLLCSVSLGRADRVGKMFSEYE